VMNEDEKIRVAYQTTSGHAIVPRGSPVPNTGTRSTRIKQSSARVRRTRRYMMQRPEIGRFPWIRRVNWRKSK